MLATVVIVAMVVIAGVSNEGHKLWECHTYTEGKKCDVAWGRIVGLVLFGPIGLWCWCLVHSLFSWEKEIALSSTFVFCNVTFLIFYCLPDKLGDAKWGSFLIMSIGYVLILIWSYDSYKKAKQQEQLKKQASEEAAKAAKAAARLKDEINELNQKKLEAEKLLEEEIDAGHLSAKRKEKLKKKVQEQLKEVQQRLNQLMQNQLKKE